jgi:hypothetical protein
MTSRKETPLPRADRAALLSLAEVLAELDVPRSTFFRSSSLVTLIATMLRARGRPNCPAGHRGTVAPLSGPSR